MHAAAANAWNALAYCWAVRNTKPKLNRQLKLVGWIHTDFFRHEIACKQTVSTHQIEIIDERDATHRNEFLLLEEAQTNVTPDFRTFLALSIDQFIFVQCTVDVILRLEIKRMNESVRELWAKPIVRTCKIDPNASNAFEQFSSDLVTSNSLSNAPFVSLIRKYKIPISVNMSMLSPLSLWNRETKLKSNPIRWIQSMANSLQCVLEHFDGFR